MTSVLAISPIPEPDQGGGGPSSLARSSPPPLASRLEQDASPVPASLVDPVGSAVDPPATSYPSDAPGTAGNPAAAATVGTVTPSRIVVLKRPAPIPVDLPPPAPPSSSSSRVSLDSDPEPSPREAVETRPPVTSIPQPTHPPPPPVRLPLDERVVEAMKSGTLRDKQILLQAEMDMGRFAASGSARQIYGTLLATNSSLNTYQRMLVHRLGDAFGVKRVSDLGQVYLERTPSTALLSVKLTSLILNPITSPEPSTSTTSPSAAGPAASTSITPQNPALSVSDLAPPKAFKIMSRTPSERSSPRGPSSIASSTSADAADAALPLGVAKKVADKTYEERQAAYLAARNRIFSSVSDTGDDAGSDMGSGVSGGGGDSTADDASDRHCKPGGGAGASMKGKERMRGPASSGYASLPKLRPGATVFDPAARSRGYEDVVGDESGRWVDPEFTRGPPLHSGGMYSAPPVYTDSSTAQRPLIPSYGSFDSLQGVVGYGRSQGMHDSSSSSMASGTMRQPYHSVMLHRSSSQSSSQSQGPAGIGRTATYLTPYIADPMRQELHSAHSETPGYVGPMGYGAGSPQQQQPPMRNQSWPGDDAYAAAPLGLSYVPQPGPALPWQQQQQQGLGQPSRGVMPAYSQLPPRQPPPSISPPQQFQPHHSLQQQLQQQHPQPSQSYPHLQSHPQTHSQVPFPSMPPQLQVLPQQHHNLAPRFAQPAPNVPTYGGGGFATEGRASRLSSSSASSPSVPPPVHSQAPFHRPGSSLSSSSGSSVLTASSTFSRGIPGPQDLRSMRQTSYPPMSSQAVARLSPEGVRGSVGIGRVGPRGQTGRTKSIASTPTEQSSPPTSEPDQQPPPPRDKEKERNDKGGASGNSSGGESNTNANPSSSALVPLHHPLPAKPTWAAAGTARFATGRHVAAMSGYVSDTKPPIKMSPPMGSWSEGVGGPPGGPILAPFAASVQGEISSLNSSGPAPPAVTRMPLHIQPHMAPMPPTGGPTHHQSPQQTGRSHLRSPALFDPDLGGKLPHVPRSKPATTSSAGSVSGGRGGS